MSAFALSKQNCLLKVTRYKSSGRRRGRSRGETKYTYTVTSPSKSALVATGSLIILITGLIIDLHFSYVVYDSLTSLD